MGYILVMNPIENLIRQYRIRFQLALFSVSSVLIPSYFDQAWIWFSIAFDT
jgi:hypothetical protein